MNTLRETAETFALNQWLSDYPVRMSYDEIILNLVNDKYGYDYDIVVWEPIEDYPGEDIAEMIQDTREAFERDAGELVAQTCWKFSSALTLY